MAKKNTTKKPEMPQWKIDQMVSKVFTRGFRSYQFGPMGIKQFKREHRGDSKAITAYKTKAWNAVKGIPDNEISTENN